MTVHGSLYADALYNPTLVADSDKRLKTNIEPLLNPLEDIEASRNLFSWRQEGEFEMYNYDEKRHVGLIAQSVQDVLPEVVENIHDDKHLAIRQLELIPLLVEGIRELDNRTSTNRVEMLVTSVTLMSNALLMTSIGDNHAEEMRDVTSLQASNHIRQLYQMNRKLLEDNSRLFSRMQEMEGIVTL